MPPKAQRRKIRQGKAGCKSFVTRTVTAGAGGTRVTFDKYEAVKAALLKVVPKRKDGLPLKDVARGVARHVPKEMLPKPHSALWLTMAVKLDLEARGLIERVPDAVPQRLRRC